MTAKRDQHKERLRHIEVLNRLEGIDTRRAFRQWMKRQESAHAQGTKPGDTGSI